MSNKIVKRLNECERAELHYKSEIEKEISLMYLDGRIDEVNDYFLGDGTVEGLKRSPLYKICKHFYTKYIVDYASLQYWSLEDYFQECLINYTLTVNACYDVTVEYKRTSPSELWNTWCGVKINECYFYRSILAHCKFIALEFVRNCNKDNTKINYGIHSLDSIMEVTNSNLTCISFNEATSYSA